MRIALYGGSFDPIHNGHIELAQAFVEALSLDKVIFMPTATPPHKLKSEMAAAEQRLAMCKLATAQLPWAEVSDAEISRGGASFTVDTLTDLTAAYPDADWFLLTGADMFVTLPSWYRFADIARMATLCTVPRDDKDAAELRARAERMQEQGARCFVLPQAVTQVSSTQLRDMARAGKDMTALVPPCVADYICAQRLYTATDNMRQLDDEEQYLDILRARLTEKRFAHSLAVADRAAFLAEKYGADVQKARKAGLLHDIMKDTDRNTQLQILQEFGILIDTATKASPPLWHAVSGAAFLQHILHIDEDIVTAVRYHTTGRAGMSLLEKIVYLADFTSADRTYPDVEKMRVLSEQDMTAAMLFALQYTVTDLANREKPIHPDTVYAYNELVCEK
ncbi:MAG: nicotinate (nicotinamide) nucleotide adenylyltransferase [Clostridia bacterium]|nr:nicotinate (nicotinamide) nucleotide adenylyltransferase [Clostridia bacterium]